MEGYSRSRSYGSGMMQVDSYYGPPRSYSTSYAQTQLGNFNNNYNNNNNNHINNRDLKLKKGKRTSGSSSSKAWGFGDPEFQRKKRVASYKMYSVEGKMKGSLRKSFRWLKDKYTQVLYGWW